MPQLATQVAPDTLGAPFRQVPPLTAPHDGALGTQMRWGATLEAPSRLSGVEY